MKTRTDYQWSSHFHCSLPDVRYGVVAGAVRSHVTEARPHPERALAVLDDDLVDLEGIDAGHLDLLDAVHQIGSQVVEGAAQALVDLRIGFVAGQNVLGWKKARQLVGNTVSNFNH